MAHNLQYLKPNDLILNYRELPKAIITKVAPFFGINDPKDLDKMSQRTQFHSKQRNASGYLPFSEDSKTKRAGASKQLKRMIDHWARPHYDKLEALTQGFASTNAALTREASS